MYKEDLNNLHMYKEVLNNLQWVICHRVEEGQAICTLHPLVCWTKEVKVNPVAWLGEVVGEESQMIGQQALCTKKKKHPKEKFEGGSSVWTKPALEPGRWGQPALVIGTHP